MSNIIGKRIKPIIRKWWQFFNEITQYVACSEGATLTERSISFLRIQAPHVSEANIGPEQPHRHKLVPTPQPIWLAPPCLKRPRKQAPDLSDNVNLSLYCIYITFFLFPGFGFIITHVAMQCRLNVFTCRHYRPGPSSTRKDTFGRPVARFDVNYTIRLL